MQILKRKWTHMCLENKLFPVYCLLGDISSLSSPFFSRPFERAAGIRYFKTQHQRKMQEGKWLTTFSEGHLHPCLQIRSCDLHSKPRGMALPPIWVSTAHVRWIPAAAIALFQLQRNLINEKSFPSALPLFLKRNLIKLIFLLSFFPQDLLPHPFSHTLFLGLSILAPSGESQRYYRLVKQVLNEERKHQRCEGYSLPHGLQGEAPGDDRWAWSMQHLPPSLIYLPSLLLEAPRLPMQ